ncbi:hypothetical protein [Rhodohalobacter sp.]|uniref:hypothetical protein n=1 Tax=Rhodohalobacter sp. TaxID=1974210 RepID=UPI002ACDDAD1|nr:hypothetical protein [Rhodohalobacter sp.]MDZ7757629.1 hypothetical protein [Rhodohalobacter sp.]
MRSLLTLILFTIFFTSCTTTRWVVTDQNAVDGSAEPRVVSDRQAYILDSRPTVDEPIAKFQLYQIKDLEFPERVRVERTVQEYKPKWGFVLLGIAGAATAVVAANTGVILSGASVTQKIGLNLSAGLLSILSFTNLESTGDPIYTGETKLMRQSGVEARRDSVMIQPDDSVFVDVNIFLQDETLFSQEEVPAENGQLDLNLGSFADEMRGKINRDSEIRVRLSHDGLDDDFIIPTAQFLAPYLNINALVANLRSTPEGGNLNIVTEVGQGSFLELMNDDAEDFYRVQYEGSEYFVRKESGSIEWLSTADSGSALVFEFAELPFGEIDVEHSMPVLKPNNSSDRGLIISNGLNNGFDQRQYLQRDHQLFEAYLNTSFRLRDAQITTITEQQISSQLDEVEGMEGDGSLYVYLSGFGAVRERNNQPAIHLITDNGQGETLLPITEIFSELKRMNPGSLFLFIDLDYSVSDQQTSNGINRNGSSGLLQRTANNILRDLPNSVVVFSNRPGQQSSIYTGILDGNKRHSIFNYFLAEAIQQRKTRMSDLVNHLDRNVDYTSRRLHDQPQDIQAFGNLNLNLAQ